MKTTHKQNLIAAALIGALALTMSVHAADITPAEARAIAKEAYIYGYPMVDGYRVQYDYFEDRTTNAGAKLKVPEASRYAGLSGYKKLLEQKLDAVMIISPPL